MPQRTTVQMFAMLVALAFVGVGILGFIPGITTDYGDMTFATTDSGAKLFGVFHVSILHNLVHLGFGLLGLALARTVDGARLYLVGGGLIYIVLWIYGLAIDLDSDANFLPIDNADNWLHFGLGVAMVVVGFVTGRQRIAATTTPPPPAP
jgi:hypothetical protein